MSMILSPRGIFLGIFTFCVIAMVFAVFYLERTLGLPPCPLCMTQRLFVVLTGAFALLGAIHNPGGWGRRVYAGFCVLWAGIGAGVAGRHVWLQGLPEDLVPACGPSLEYMLETFPLSETLSLIMMGDGNCADIQWTFLGLSIPEQTLGVFLVLIAAAAYQFFRRG